MSRILVVVGMTEDNVESNYRGQDVERSIIKKLNKWDGMIAFTDYATDGKICSELHQAASSIDKNGASRLLSTYLTPYVLVRQLFRFMEHDTIEQIEVCGLASSSGVATTALMAKAAFSDVSVRVDKSCTAGSDDANGEAAFEVMRSNGIEIY